MRNFTTNKHNNAGAVTTRNRTAAMSAGIVKTIFSAVVSNRLMRMAVAGLLLVFASSTAFATNYYRYTSGGTDYTQLTMWTTDVSGATSTGVPTTFANAADVWNLTGAVTVAPATLAGSSWTIGGTLSISAGTFTAPMALNIGGDLNITGTGIFHDNTAGNVIVYIGGNHLRSGSGVITITAAVMTIHFNGASTISAPKTFSSNSTSANVIWMIDAGCFVQMNSNWAANATSTFTVNGGLNCNGFQVTGTNAFVLGANGTIATGAQTPGLSSGVAATGCIRSTGGRTFPTTANYIFNSNTTQAMGTGYPGSSTSPGSVTIDNSGAAVVTINFVTTMASGTTLNLKNGTLNIVGTPANYTMAAGSTVNVDGGNFSSAPFYGAGVNVNYVNLGTNATLTTGFEWVTPMTGNININKTPTVTLGGSKVLTGKVTIASGATFAGGANSLSLTGNWTNNGTFTPGTSSVTFNGTGSQTIGGTSTNNFNNLTLNNSTGVTLGSNANVAAVLALTSGILTTTSSFSVSVTGSSAVTRSASTTSNFVNGTLVKAINTFSSLTYEVGDADYAPVTLTFTGAGTGGSIGINCNNSASTISGSFISSGLNTGHFWTLINNSAAGPTAISPQFTYNSVTGGTQSTFKAQIKSAGVWGSVLTPTNAGAGPYTTTVAAVSPLASAIGVYAVGVQVTPPPALSPVAATEDNLNDGAHNITFTDDPTWRGAVTQITAKLGAGPANTLTAGVDYVLTSGNLKLIPTSSNGYLTTAGSYTITISSTGYGDDAATQVITAGAANKLVVVTAPVGPLVSGGSLQTQPVIRIGDQFGNIVTGSSATVVATAIPTTGTWTLGGTTSQVAASGLATYGSPSALTATTAGPATLATIAFTSAGLSSVTATFSIPPTGAQTWHTKAGASSADLSLLSSWTSDASGGLGATPLNFTTANQTYTIDYGTSPSLASNWSVSGSGSNVVVGGSSAIQFTIPSGITMTGTVNVAATGTLDVESTTVPALGSVNAASTLILGGSVNYSFPSSTGNNYGNITCTNTAVISIPVGTYNLGGNFRLMGAGTLFTNGVVVCTGVGATTINVAGNFALGNNAFLSGSASGSNVQCTVNVSGNDSLTGQAVIQSNIGSTLNGVTVVHNNTSSSISSPQILYSTSSNLSFYGTYVIAANTVTKIGGTQFNVMATGSGAPASATGMTVNGTLIIPSGAFVRDQSALAGYLSATFSVSPGATLMMGDASGVNLTSGTTLLGFTNNTTFVKLNSAANYVFNGTAAQITGIHFASLLTVGSNITSGGSIVCNNTAGTAADLTLSAALTVNSLGSVGLQNGTLSTTNLTLSTGANVKVDNGHFNATPGTYGNIHLSYVNLGNNNLALSTANTEWPASFDGDVTVNKTGATISLNASKGVINSTGSGAVTLTSGTLSAGSNTLSLKGTWTNSSTSNFNAGTGTVSFNGSSAQSIASSAPTTWNTLNINNASGVILNQATTIGSGATVQLQNGTFTLTAALTMSSGSNVVRDGGTFNVTPTGGYSGVNLTYADLGTNASPTVALEWPASFTGNVTVNKAGTVTLDATKTLLTGNVTLTSGTFSGSSFTLPMTGNWTNNGGTFSGGTGTVQLSGAGSQTIGGSATTTFNNLTLGAAASLGVNTSVSGILALGGNVLTTGAYAISTPSGAGNVTRTSGYVAGTLTKNLSAGIAAVNFETGDVNYAPVSLALDGSGGTGGSLSVKVTNGNHPNLGTSGIDGVNHVSHYWTISKSSPTGFTNVTPTFTYNNSDIGGGDNSAFVAQNYSSGTWGSILPATNNATPSTTLSSGTASYTGDFAVGQNPPGVPPALTADFTPPTVDNLSSHPITFTDDGTWAESFTSVTSQRTGSPLINTLTLGVDYTVSGPGGTLSLIPNGGGHTYLDTSGIYTISVYAAGYTGVTVNQVVNNGAAHHLVMTTQPVGPLVNGGALNTQPVVSIKDQYGNATPSSAVVTAAVGSGSYTLGGPSLMATALSGTATFSGLTATSLGPVTGTIQFTSGILTATTSATFVIPAPNSPTLTAAGGATVDNPFTITFVDNSTWRAAVTPTSVTINGTTLPAAAWSLTAGSLTLTPSLSALLQTAGTYTVAVAATGFASTSCVQTIGVGVANKLVMVTQPTAPSYNGGTLATQPVVKVADQYGNLVNSTASVTSAVGAGSWTLGGPSLSATAVAGTATFSNLTASSAAAVTGATIVFSSTGLTSVTSATFNIPSPPTTYYNKTGVSVDLSDVNNWGLNSDGTGTHPANFTSPSQAFKVVNGTTPTLADNWVVSGLGSYVIVGDGTTAITCVLPTSASLTGLVNVNSNATLTIGAGVPTFGTLSPLSTVVFNGNSPQNIPNYATYGSLTYSGPSGGQGNLQSGVYNILGNLTINGVAAVGYLGASVLTFNVSRDFTYTSGLFSPTNSSASAFVTMYIGGNTTIGGTAQFNENLASPNIYMSGNLTVTGSATFTGLTTIFRFNNSSTTITSPEVLTYNSAGTSTAVAMIVQANVFVKYGSNWVTTAAAQQITNFGTLDFAGFTMSGSGTCTNNSGSTVYTSNLTGLAGSITTTNRSFVNGSNYVFYGSGAVTTGSFAGAGTGAATTATPFPSGNYVTINNATGTTTLSAATTFNSGSSLNLQNGTFSTTNLTLNSGVNVNVDNGHFSATPTYPAAPGVNLSYRNLGNNNLTVTTNTTDWPASFAGNVTVSKPGATISLDASKTLTGTASLITLTSGTLSAGSNTITTSGSWANNAGTGAFTAGTGTVVCTGSVANSIGGSFGTTFNVLTIANTGGITLNAATTFASGKTLNLQTGAFANGTNLSMSSGSNVNVDGGSLVTAPAVYSGVNLTYMNLGTSASPTTSNEWPSSFNGNVTINKPSLTVTQNAGKTAGNITLTSGTLITGSNTLSLTGNWINNGGTLTPGTTSVTFNGTGAQNIGGSTATGFSGITLNNAAGLSIGLNTTLSGILTLNNGILSTGGNTLTVPAAAANVSRTASTTTNYVFGNLTKPTNSATAVDYEVGDINYAPVNIAPSGTATGGSFNVTVAHGNHPSYAGAVVDGTYDVAHYWTITPLSVTGISSVSPTFTYNNADIGGGSNTGWISQIYNNTSSSWGSAMISNTTEPTGNTTLVSNVGISAFTNSGAFVVGLNDANTPPVFTAASGVNEDNASTTPATYTLTPATGFPSIADWKSHITLVTATGPTGTHTLTGGGTDYGVGLPSLATSGTFSLVPTNTDNYLTTSGVYTITISSIGYTAATLVQTINAGAAAALSITTQPTAPLTNPGAFVTQPVIGITDQFGNIAGSSATVTANTGAGAWTPGGSVTASGTGSAVFAGLTASSLGPVTGATILFTSGALTPVTSNSFNLPAPNPPALTAAVGATVDNPINITFIENATWRGAITSVKVGGTTISPTAWSTSSGTLTLIPANSALLQSVGTKSVTVQATGYTDDAVNQFIGAGVGATLSMNIQPTAPPTNGANLATQPAVNILDQYGNATTSTATVTASVGAGVWTLGGTVAQNGVSGLATYTNLSATSVAAVTGATIVFSITSGVLGTRTVTSSAFNIPNPPVIYYDVVGSGVNLNNLSSWTTSASGTGGTAPTSFTSGLEHFVIKNGTNPTLNANWTVSGTASYVTLGDGVAAVNFTIPSGNSFTGIIDVAATATLTLTNATVPTLRTLDAASTVVFNASSAQAIPLVTYGNLTYSGSSIGTMATGTENISGNLTVASGTVTAATGEVLNVTGNLVLSGGTLTNAGAHTVNLTGNLNNSSAGGGLTPTSASVLNFKNSASTPTITWSGAAMSNTTFSVNATCSTSLSTSLPLASTCPMIVNGTLNTNTNSISGSGAFTVNSGGTINTASTTGLTGSITTSGSKTFNAGANYIFSAASDVTTPWVSAPGAPNNVSVSNAVTWTNNASFNATGTITVPSGATMDMSTFALTSTPTVSNSGTIQTENTGSTPLPTGYTWGGTVAYAGAGAQTVVVGTYNNLTLNNAAGASLAGNATVNGTLALSSGRLTVGVNTLSLGSSATTSGSYSSSNMIVASNASGQVQKTFSGSGSFAFPIGDASNYTPITLNVTGAGTAGVYLRNVKHPNNGNTTNYINRYWHVGISGITSYSVTSANYVSPGDVVGTEANIYAGRWTGSLPWVIGAAETSSTLVFGSTTASSADFSGINAPAPSFTVAAAASTCVGTSVTYATQGGMTNYVWNVPGTGGGVDYTITGGGISSTDNTVTLNWVTTGPKTVTVNYTDQNGLIGTAATNTTTVNTLSVSAGNSSPACAGGTVNLTSTPSGTATPATYSWSGPAVYSSTASNPVLSVSSTANAGTYTVTVTGGGCTATATTIVTVNTIGITAANDGPACVGGTVNLTSTPGGTSTPVSYSWSGPSFTAATQNTNLTTSATTAMTGTYTVTVTAAGSGCSATNTTNVTINTLSITAANDGPACVGGTVNLTSTPGGTATPVSYSWSGPSFTAAAQNTNLTTDATTDMTGTYTVTVTAAGSACSASNTTDVTINTLSVAAANDGPACVGGTVNLTSTPGGSATPTGYAWSGPSYSASGQNVMRTGLTTAMSGTYTVTVTASGSGCSASNTTDVTINTIGIAAANDGPACVGGTINLSSTPSGTATPTGYAWSGPSFSAGTQNTNLTTSATTDMNGIYTVTVTAIGSNCSAIATTNVVVNTLATAPSNDGPACEGSTVNLFSNITGTATPTGYSWSGPSFTSATANTSLSSVTTAMTGTYNFTVTASGSACIAMGSTNVVVNNLGLTAANDGPACVGGTVNFTSTPSGSLVPTNYSWVGPNSFSSTNQNPVLTGATLPAAGTYTVTMSGTGTGCSTTATTTVTINTIGITAGNDGPACVGGTVNLTSTPSGTAVPTGYAWAGPPAFMSTVQSPNLTTSATTDMTGIYTVTVVANGSNCTATTTTNVVVNDLGIVANNDGPACLGAVVVLTSTPSGSAIPTTYSWSGPASYTNTNQNTSVAPVTFANAGVYTVTVNADGSACTATATTNVVIKSLSINAFNDGPTCAGLTNNLTSIPGGTSTPTGYAWSGPLGFTASTQNTLLSPAATNMSGTYTVTVISTGTGCIAHAITTVSILPVPLPISGIPQVCVGLTTTLSDATTGGVWTSLNTGVATIGTAGAATSPHIVSGLYMGTSTISYTTGNGCAAVVVVTVNPNPVIIGMMPVCIGTSITLSDDIPGGIWTAANTKATVGSTSGILTGVTIGTDPITYTLPTTCRAISTATINPTPSAIGGTASVCQGQTTTLNTTSSGGTWSSSNTLVAATAGSTGATMVVSGIGAGTATITYMLPTGCYSTKVVTVNSLAPITGNAPVCQGATITLSDLALGGLWTSATPARATVGSVSGIVTGVSGGTVRITYTTFGGCVATVIATVNPTGTILGNAGVCEGATTTLSDATAGGAWTSTAGVSVTTGTTTTTVTGVTAGTATVSYTITATGCAATRVVTVSAAPGAISGIPAMVCVGSTVTLSDAVAGGSWISSAPTKATVGTDGTVTGVAAGTSTISYKMVAGGCQVTTIVTVNATPGAFTGNTPVCQGATITLHNSVTGGVWSTADATATVGSSSGIVTGVSGSTALISYATGASCQNTVVVTVNPITPILGAAPMCVGSSVSLSDLTPGGAWSSSNVAKGTVSVDGTVTGIAAGTTNITYLMPTGCKSVVVETINALPAAISGGSVVCADGSILNLSDATAGGTWSATGGATVDGSGHVSGVSAGTASISYTVNTCFVAKTVTVSIAPTALTGNTPICAGSTLVLGESVSGGVWSSSAAAVATVSSTGTVTGVTGGTANISYVTGSGCTTSVTVTVNTILPISGNPTICLGSTTNLSDATLGGTWSSTDGTGSVTVGTSGVVTGSGVGTATITYTTASCSRTITVTVNPTPSAISGTLTVCVSNTTTLSDDGSGTWSSNNTAIATVVGSTGVVTGMAAGTARISYTSGFACSATAIVTVNAGPSTIGGASSVCTGATITLSDLVGGGVWSSTGTYASIDGSGNVLGITPGTEVITYTVGSCSRTKSITVLASPTPVLGTLVACVGGVTFVSDATTPGVSWTSGNTGVATISASGAVTGVSTGTANITYLISGGCIATATVTVNNVPSGILGNTPVCPGTSITVSDLTAGGTWSSSNVAIATIGTDGTLTGVAAGTATITYAVTGGGCRATAAVTVTAITAITGLSTVCTGSSIALTNSTAGGTWSSLDATVTVGPSTGVVTGVSSGTATITYTFAGGGCSAMKVVTVNATPTAINGNALLCIGTQLMLTDDVSGGVWTSSNPAVASVVSGTGVTTGVAAGTARITYAIGGCQAVTTVTVNTAAPVTGTLSICAGSATTLHSGTGGTWSSSTPVVGTVSTSGVVNGLSAGTTTISYTLGSGCVNTAVVTVNPVPTTINGNGPVCAGGTLNLSDDVTGGTWASSNGVVTIDGTSGVATAVATGTARITYTSAGCYTTIIITVGATPVAIGGTLTVCEGAATTLFDATLGGAWSSSSPSNGSVDPVSGVVAGLVGGTTTISYTLPGCGSITADVTINATPAAMTGNAAMCIGNSITLGETTPGGVWSSSNAHATVDGSGNVSGVTAGTSVISYTVASCSATTIVTVVTAPAAITAPSFICLGSTTTLYDATPGGLWSTTDGAIVSLGTGTGVVTGVGLGTATITYSIGAGCSATTTLSVNTSVSPIFGSLSICIGTTTVYTDATSGGAWSSSNTSVATVGTDGIVNGTTAGTSTISYNASGCISTQTITVSPAPAGIGGPGVVCEGGAISLSDATVGGVWSTLSTYITLDGSGNVGGVNAGVATVTYTSGAGCFVTRVITINPAPSAITGTQTVCVGATSFMSDATPVALSWSSNTPSVATISMSGVVTGMATGTSTITYTINTGCFITAVVTVNAQPSGITNNTPVCVGSTMTLSDASAGGTWSSSNGAIATVGTDGTVTGVAGGTATITYATPGSGCRATAVVTVNAGPNAGIISPASGTICAGSTLGFGDGASGGVWSSTNMTVGTVSTTGVVRGLTGGTTTISYTVTNICGSAAATATVTVNPAPDAGTITGTATVCAGSTTALTDGAAGGVWSSSNGAIATVGTDGTVTGVAGGTARISYTVTSGCGTAVATSVVTVNAFTAGTISGATSVSVGLSISLSDAVAGGVWSASNGNATVGSTGTVTGVTTGTVTISYTVTNSCGTVSATQVVTVTAASSGITGTLSLCVGTTTALTDATPGGTWRSSNTFNATVGTSGIVTGVAAGTANISYTVGGVPTIVMVTVNPQPSGIGGSTTVCVGSSVTMSDFTPGGTWTSTAGVSVTTGTTLTTVTGITAGLNTVSYTLSTGCYVVRNITVNDVPGPINGTLLVCVGSVTHLTDATTGGVSWTSGTPAVATINASGNATGVSPGTTIITYAITTGCKATATVTVHTCPSAPGHGGSVSGTVTVLTGTSVSVADETMSGIWSSGNTTVATVDNAGLVTGVAPGSTNITHVTTDAQGAVSTTVTPVVVSAVVGDVRVVPNPNNGTFTLRGTLGTAQDEEVSVEVTDVLGQVIYKNKVTARSGKLNEKVTMDNTYANGMYMLTIHSNSENKVFHFVIEK